jgi:hemolysin D
MSGVSPVLEAMGAKGRKAWGALENWVDRRFGQDEFAGHDATTRGFSPDAVVIEEAPVPLSAHAALYAVLALLVIAILWAIFGSVDRIVVAQGKIATRTPLVVMQPFSTSRILKIDVKAGDHVRKGQVLVAFDPAFAQADVVSLQHKVDTLTAQTARLEAQLAGTGFAGRPGDNPARVTQVQIFNQEMSDYQAEVNSATAACARSNPRSKWTRRACPESGRSWRWRAASSPSSKICVRNRPRPNWM